MKWSEFKIMVDEVLENNDVQDPEIDCIDISAGVMDINQDIIIGVEDEQLVIF